MAGSADEPATKGDLDKVRGEVGSLGLGLRTEIKALDIQLGVKLRAMKDEIVLELAGVIQRAMGMQSEEYERGVSAVDEKYQDLPPRVSKLEADVADLKRGTPAPRRSTRKK